MVQFVLHRSQTGFNIAETLSVRELSKSHAKKLIKTRERLHMTIAVVPVYALAEPMHRQEVHQLRKQLAVHNT
jgi:hypothetical protein